MSAEDGPSQLIEPSVPVAEYPLKGQAFDITVVTLWDRTDSHDELVRIESSTLASDDTQAFTGGIFVVEEQANERGMIFVRRSPMPESRPNATDRDIQLRKQGDELSVTLYRAESEDEQDLWQALPFEGGDLGRTMALQIWERSLRPDSELHRVPRFVTNTWGDRSRDSRITEEFILREIDAARSIGADVVRIDDGWQMGLSGNSAFQGEMKTEGLTGFWGVSNEFWEVHPERFPNGLGPVLDRAKEAGVEIGLWYAPDSDNELANWEKDADQIVSLYKKYGVRFFKIDGLDVVSPLAQERIHQLLDRVRDASDSQVLLMIDITGNHKRPGFLGAIGEGNLFVQNRYTDWGKYWPHRTLRSLWRLSHWVDPGRLRFEILNNQRNINHHMYAGNPLAPSKYPADYLFASVMMSNPLGFFEVSNLPEDYSAELEPLVRVWREHRSELADCSIIPIGDEPSGRSWTGFLAVDEQAVPRYLLCLKEFAESEDHFYQLPVELSKQSKLTMLHGRGSATVREGGVAVEIDQTPGYLFIQIDP